MHRAKIILTFHLHVILSIVENKLGKYIFASSRKIPGYKE